MKIWPEEKDIILASLQSLTNAKKDSPMEWAHQDPMIPQDLSVRFKSDFSYYLRHTEIRASDFLRLFLEFLTGTV